MIGRCSAPGKIVVTGEYAVLSGAPAIVMAVDRRAVVSGLSDGETRGDDRLLSAVTKTLGIDSPSTAVTLNTDGFFAVGTDRERAKLGLGSSAALVAALCRALMPKSVSRQELFAHALAAHRLFQAGAGSGVDIAASVYGGVRCYRIDDDSPCELGWPSFLAYSVWWSGVSASTADKLGRLARFRDESSRRALVDAAAAVVTHWTDERGDPLLAAFAGYVDALRTFDIRHDLGVFDAGHDRLLQKAARLNVIYKPCGAGGGDIGIAISNDPDALVAFAGEAEKSGFRQVDIGIDERGAECAGVAA